MVNIPVWKAEIMASCGVVIVNVTQRNYRNGFDVVFRLFGGWTLWRLFSDVFLFCTLKYFLKVMTQKWTHDYKLLGLKFSRKKVDICAHQDMKGSSARSHAMSLRPVCCGVFCLIIFRWLLSIPSLSRKLCWICDARPTLTSSFWFDYGPPNQI